MSNSNLTKSATADRSRLTELLRARVGDRELPAGPPVLSFAQERMWFFDQLEPGSAAYNVHAGLRLRGPFDVGILQRSLDHVVNRHEALRSTFPATAGKPKLTLDAPPVVVRRLDLSASANVEEALNSAAVAEAGTPFDLSAGPLARVTHLQLAEHEQALLVTMHHIVSDGWSFGLFINEMMSCYDAFARGAAPSLPDVLQYPAFAARQRGALQGAALQQQLQFWRETLAGAPKSIKLPTDRRRPSRPSYRGGTLRAEIDVALTAHLQALAKAEGATLFMVLLAAFKILLARWSGDEDLVVGTPVAGRVGGGADAAIGCFINTVLLRSDLSDAPTFRAFLARVRRQALAAFDNGDVPFDKLVEELQPPRDPSRNPLYQVMFNLLTLGDAPLHTPAGVHVDWLPWPDEPSKLDLTLYAAKDGDRVSLRMVYAADVFSADSMGELLSQYVQLLNAIVANPDASVFAERDPQHPAMANAAVERQLEYWRRELSAVPALDLPTDRPRPAVPTFRGAAQRFQLSPETTAAIKNVAREFGATEHTTLLAGFGAFLRLWSGQADLAIGSSDANRPQVELDQRPGFAADTRVLRLDYSGDPTFREMVQRVAAKSLDAHANSDVPLSRLVEILQPARNLNRSPFSDVLFTLQNAPIETECGGAAPAAASMSSAAAECVAEPALSPMRATSGGSNHTVLDTGTAQLDLRLSIEEAAGGYRGTFEYNADLFDDQTIIRALDRFEALLDACVRDPDRPLNELPRLTLSERELLASWNRTERASEGLSWHEMVRAQAVASPDAVAITCCATTTTYADLMAQAAMIAGGLRRRRIRAGDIVGVFVERSAGMVAAILGVAQCGAAYLPLDPAFPAERLEYMVRDAGVALIVTDDSLWSSAERFGAPTMVLGRIKPATKKIAVDCEAEALAYVIYTSGSTGLPKGVEVPHGALGNFLQSMREQPGFGKADTLFAVTTLSFDIAALELMLPLVCGGTVAIASRAEAIDPVALRAALIASRATVMQATPITWRMLLDAGWVPPPGFRAFCGGEAMPRELAQQLLSHGVELWNLYGPTETTVWSTVGKVDDTSGRLSIGRPIANTYIRILDADGHEAAPGAVGEICIGGAGLARGYHNRSDLTAERFVPDGDSNSMRLYRTGDRGRWRSDGRLECFGRIDHQVKVRGFRIELGEIEAVLAGDAAVKQAVVHVSGEGPAARLDAYVVPEPRASIDFDRLRERVARALPAYMHPAAYSVLKALPLTANGKIDRNALPAPDGSATAREFVAPRDAMESLIASTWRDVLGVEQVGARESFFDLGGHSLLIVQVQSRLTTALGRSIPVVELFQYPTVESLARHLGGGAASGTMLRTTAEDRQARRRGGDHDVVAIIGMAARFPGAPKIETFWQNLRDGVESLRRFTVDELVHAGIPAELALDPNYIPVRGVLDDADCFDAQYFGYTPRDAELIDPQQRVFLEVAAESLDRAGYDPYSYHGAIGVFAGASLNGYIGNVLADPAVAGSLTGVQLLLAGDKDHLPTRVSYKLNLRGPSINVQTACSTSLVAVHQACRSLLDLDCDIALAGGVSIGVPLQGGYLYVEGGILSPDGHCRAFDAQADGTVPGNGCGVVVLKRLSEAVRDGDVIHAVIRGSGINNDGSDKVSYTAPSVRGQADALALAYAAAGVSPTSVGYIEAHGTATPLGDPIEIQALTTMMREHTRERGFCAIGSLKTNVGHMDAAAGVGGLIKAALAVEHGEVPPSLHYWAPNREIDFDDSPFRVNSTLRPWPAAETPRRAGVSSFGIGGTNAHVVLEQAPPRAPSGASRPWQVLPLSARTRTALSTMAQNLANHLEQHSDVELADVAHTLSVGRPAFEYRRAVVCDTAGRAIAALHKTDDASTRRLGQERPKVVFMFPGQGAQYAGMGRELYATEASYRAAIEECAAIVAAHGVDDIKTVLLARTPAELAAANLRLGSTLATQLALFVTQYALARTFVDWGVVPDALIGHSIGEYVAACLSGALALTDAIALVVTRGKLMEQAPAGAMLAAEADEQTLSQWLDDQSLWLAAINGPGQCVVAGRIDAIDGLRRHLTAVGIDSLPLRTAGAFHSGLMDHVVGPLIEAARNRRMVSPRIPFISNVTGRPITEEQIADPSYWGRHLRQAVRFSAGVNHLLGAGATVFVEVGPGVTLGALVRRHAGSSNVAIVASMRQAAESEAAGHERLATAAARLWTEGVAIDWAGYRKEERRWRVELPSYPFERQRYWIDAPAAASSQRAVGRVRSNDIAQWFSAPAWKRLTTPSTASGDASDVPGHWLLFGDGTSLTAGLASHLRARGNNVVTVARGTTFHRTAADRFEIDPAKALDYQQLLGALKNDGWFPDHVIHAWLTHQADGESTEQLLQHAFYGPLFLAQAIGDVGTGRPLRITVLAHEIFDVVGGESLVPAKATVMGPIRVVPAEYPDVSCGLIELAASEWRSPEAAVLEQLVDIVTSKRDAPVLAVRRGFEWLPALERVSLPAKPKPVFRHRGVYLLTGGYGGIGRSLGNVLAEQFGARLVLVGRRGVPPRGEWASLLSNGAAPDVLERIATVQSLEAAGAEVLPLSGDVTSEHDLRAIVEAAVTNWGQINGVIHAAGIAGGGVIQLKTRELAERVLAPKVAGTEALMRALEGTPLDFIALCSSITALEGGPGQVDYCAANAFLDAYATNYARQSGTNIISINWNAWRDVGMAVEAAMPEEVRRRRAKQLREAIAPLEGAQAFLRLMHGRVGAQVQISPYPIDVAVAATAQVEGSGDETSQPSPSPAGHDRPELPTAFAEPQNEIEERVAAIWQELFGIARIGVTDDFFALGGHSLLATQIASRLKAEFGLPLSLHEFFAAPTITGVSDLLLEQLLEQEALTDGGEATLDDLAKR